MSDVMAQRDDIENRASEWILRRDRGELAPVERQELEAWLSADSRHREAYLRLLDLWRLAGGLKAWNSVNGRTDVDVLAATPKRAVRRWPLSMAAALVLAVCGSLLWQIYAAGDNYATEVGGYRRVSLSDGSVLQLNTDSRVMVKLTEHSRVVKLLRGEAYFEVAHDARRPFDVMAGNSTVRAVGTAFSVHLRDAERVDVLVAEGRVSVREQGASGRGSQAGENPEANEVPATSVVEAGQVAAAQSDGIRVASVAPADVARRLGWQSGVLHFKNQSLAEVVTEFNRYNQRKLVIMDERLVTLEVGGSFRTGDLESFVAALRGVRRIHVDESADMIRLSDAAP